MTSHLLFSKALAPTVFSRLPREHVKLIAVHRCALTGVKTAERARNDRTLSRSDEVTRRLDVAVIYFSRQSAADDRHSHSQPRPLL